MFFRSIALEHLYELLRDRFRKGEVLALVLQSHLQSSTSYISQPVTQFYSFSNFLTFSIHTYSLIDDSSVLFALLIIYRGSQNRIREEKRRYREREDKRKNKRDREY